VVTPFAPELTVEGVLAWVRGLMPDLPVAQEARLAQRLAAVSEGVPLFLQFIVDDIGDHRARGEPIAAIMSMLEALPAPFSAYAGQQLAAMREMRRQTPGAFDVDVAHVFALLTLIKGALPLEELRQVLQTRVNVWDLDPRIVRWFARCSVGDEPAIALLHPSLADIVRSALGESGTTADMRAEVEGQLIAHCRASWSRGSLYALTNLPLHQIESGRLADAIATLTDLAFLGARLAHAAAPALIARTTQDLEAADTAASAELRVETRAHRFFWATVEQDLLTLLRGAQAEHAPEVLNQLLQDNPETADRYAPGYAPWLQTAGRRAPPPLLRELRGHGRLVSGAMALSDGRLLSWSYDGTLRLWAGDGTALAELKGHSSSVLGATALSDGRLLSWSDDKTLRLWASDGTALAELKGHRDPVYGAMALSDGRLLSWSHDGTLRLWASDGAALAELEGHWDPVYGVTALSDGRLLSWSSGRTPRLWASDGAALAELKGHSESVRGAAAMSDGRLLSWGNDCTPRLWASDGEALAELTGHTRCVRGATALSDGRLLSWSEDGTLRLWASDGICQSLWVWPYAAVTRVIPHSDRRNVYWVIAGNDVLQVRHQRSGIGEIQYRFEA
jgi:hypothetical protein